MEQTSVAFTVLGIPKAQPRVKSRVIAGNSGVYDPGTANDWKTSVKAAAVETGFQVDRDVPVDLNLEFLFRRPKGHFGKKGLLASAPEYHTKKPDVDNLFKSTVDALVDCGMLWDDAAICVATITKGYCEENDAPGVRVLIETDI